MANKAKAVKAMTKEQKEQVMNFMKANEELIQLEKELSKMFEDELGFSARDCLNEPFARMTQDQIIKATLKPDGEQNRFCLEARDGTVYHVLDNQNGTYCYHCCGYCEDDVSGILFVRMNPVAENEDFFAEAEYLKVSFTF